MAGVLKQEFIEALRLTPDGIHDFLETPIPIVPTVSTPADVDSAIIANGVCAKFILDLFAPFAGLTPVELLLRIGQHNNVLESAMLAGLEYIEGTDPAEYDLTILEPQDGISYTPGEMRFTASATNGTAEGITLTIGENNPIDMKDVDGTWTQYVNMEIGDYTAIFEATFGGGTIRNTSVSFIIADYDPQNPPDPLPDPIPEIPGGTDRSALDRSLANFQAAYKHMGDLITYKVGVDALFAQMASVDQTAWDVAVIVKAKTPPGYEELSATLSEQISDVEYVIPDLNYELIATGLAPIVTTVQRIAGLY